MAWLLTQGFALVGNEEPTLTGEGLDSHSTGRPWNFKRGRISVESKLGQESQFTLEIRVGNLPGKIAAYDCPRLPRGI